MFLLRQILRPWLIVIIGAFMSIASAFITHNFIIGNNDKIQLLQTKSQQIEQTITSHWQNAGRFERDGNIALLMTLQQEEKVQKYGIDIYIQHFIRQGLAKAEIQAVNAALSVDNKTALFSALLRLVDTHRRQVIDSIDALYIEKVGLEEKIMQIDVDNTRYASIALFLQVMGLIFVLAKDMGRREWPK